MRIVWFVHAIASCWNNGNAHFLRGMGLALQALGHEVLFCEPEHSWSEENLLRDHGEGPLRRFEETFPSLRRRKYDLAVSDLAELTHGADLVVVHEWNDPALVNALGDMRRNAASFMLLFQDTHHRSATDPYAMRQFDLSGYDGVLAFGSAVADLYRKHGWSNRTWVFHEAADTSTFHPRVAENECNLAWIGNWGDEERTQELREFLIEPARSSALCVRAYGVRYPKMAVTELARSGMSYCGWLANHDVPQVLATTHFTIHVPRQAYAHALPGIPTIRVFEALACGTPLICAPWEDAEELFPGNCYLVARNGHEMRNCIRSLMSDPDLREALRRSGMAAIEARHTCGHRAAQLMDIYSSLKGVSIRKAA
jgi:spore maturation protein CgeB